MVTLAVVLLLAAGPDAADPAAEVRSALTRGHYPWYDAKEDDVATVRPPKPMEPPKVSKSGASGKFTWPDVGQMIVFCLLVLGLSVLIALLIWAWSRFVPEPEAIGPKPRRREATVRTASLPAGLAVDTDDPRGRAAQLRDRGDLAGAILHLFVHQLLLLDRLGLTRLTPGRTGRQLVRAVPEPQVRKWITSTLRLFEASYYGHEAPTFEAFEAAWADAESLERWASGRGGLA